MPTHHTVSRPLLSVALFERVAAGNVVAPALQQIAAAVPGVSFGAEINAADGIAVSSQTYLDTIERCNPYFFERMLSGKRPVDDFFATVAAAERVNWVRCIGVEENDGSGRLLAALPGVFAAPIRPDVVRSVHTNIAKNARQAYAVMMKAGHQTSAESWGTGRAVSRIPRVQGGGTQRSGQGAFGNMCRGGRMFAPTKVWRKWSFKINVNQRRYAVASAIAAAAAAIAVDSGSDAADACSIDDDVGCADDDCQLRLIGFSAGGRLQSRPAAV